MRSCYHALARRLALVALLICGAAKADDGGHALMPGDGLRSDYTVKLEMQCSGLHEKLAAPDSQGVTSFYTAADTVYALLSRQLISPSAEARRDIAKQLAFAAQQSTPDGLPLTDQYSYLTRDHMAREAIAFYDAYLITQDNTYRDHANAIADSMVKNLARTAFAYGNETHILFYPLYQKPPPHQPASAMADIDPNQNAEVGLLFTLLFHDAKSDLYQSQLASQIAHEELRAAVALVTAKGEVGLNSERPEEFDTHYGSYFLYLLLRANRLWGERDYAAALVSAGTWLGRFRYDGDLAGRYYPTWSSNPSAFELWVRLPVYRNTGIDTSAFLALLKSKFPYCAAPAYLFLAGENLQFDLGDGR